MFWRGILFLNIHTGLFWYDLIVFLIVRFRTGFLKIFSLQVQRITVQLVLNDLFLKFFYTLTRFFFLKLVFISENEWWAWWAIFFYTSCTWEKYLYFYQRSCYIEYFYPLFTKLKLTSFSKYCSFQNIVVVKSSLTLPWFTDKHRNSTLDSTSLSCSMSSYIEFSVLLHLQITLSLKNSPS